MGHHIGQVVGSATHIRIQDACVQPGLLQRREARGIRTREQIRAITSLKLRVEG